MKKYNTCRHVDKVGEFAVYVHPGCPNYSMINGTMLSSKMRCKTCKDWEPREDNDGLEKRSD